MLKNWRYTEIMSAINPRNSNLIAYIKWVVMSEVQVCDAYSWVNWASFDKIITEVSIVNVLRSSELCSWWPFGVVFFLLWCMCHEILVTFSTTSQEPLGYTSQLLQVGLFWVVVKILKTRLPKKKSSFTFCISICIWKL